MNFGKFSLVIALLLVFFTNADAQMRYETDFQIWNDTQIIVPLNKNKDWNFVLWAFGRFGNDVKTIADARVGGLITKKINKYVTLGGGYLYRFSNPTFRLKRYESRYLGLVTVTVPLGNRFTLVNRNLIQYEDRYSRPNTAVIRNRLWIKREVTVAKKKIEPYISFEPFYDTRLKAFARYRTQVGFSHKFNKTLSADFYYIRQDETGNRIRPGTLNGVGNSLKFTF